MERRFTDKGIKVVFLDVKDTLGYIESPGKLITFKPTTLRLLNTIKETLGLNIGIITNLPSSVSAEQGREMLKNAGISEFVDEALLIINHEAKTDKPGPKIYEYAAKQANVEPGECIFMGENLLEIIGAQAAGMHGILKPFPAGREFKLKAQQSQPFSYKDSGRLSEIIMEEDHLIGKRIVMATAKIVEQLKNDKVPYKAMRILTFLLDEFVDNYHHKKEEKILLPLAKASGIDNKLLDIVLKDHDQGRAYFKGMKIALDRYDLDYKSALIDFRINAEGFIQLYKAHGAFEDDVVLPAIGKLSSDLDDGVIVDLFLKEGPADLTPYLLLISNMEKLVDEAASKNATKNQLI